MTVKEEDAETEKEKQVNSQGEVVPAGQGLMIRVNKQEDC